MGRNIAIRKLSGISTDMNTRKSLAFIVELLGLFILLIMVTVIITRVFVMSRTHSLQARHLTESVILAESAAETASTSSDLKELAGRFGDMDNTEMVEVRGADQGDQELVFARAFDDKDAESGRYYTVCIRRTSEDNASGGVYVRDSIEVYPEQVLGQEASVDDRDGEPVYSLDTGHYFSEEE